VEKCLNVWLLLLNAASKFMFFEQRYGLDVLPYEKEVIDLTIEIAGLIYAQPNPMTDVGRAAVVGNRWLPGNQLAMVVQGTLERETPYCKANMQILTQPRHRKGPKWALSCFAVIWKWKSGTMRRSAGRPSPLIPQLMRSGDGFQRFLRLCLSSMPFAFPYDSSCVMKLLDESNLHCAF